MLIDRAVELVPPGFRMRERKLSNAGIGYHYFFQGPKGAVAVSVGVFTTMEQARQAAEFSHSLMPDKPSLDSGIGDQTWFWEDRRGSAVRFRLGRCLLRVGGGMPLGESRALAKRIAAQLAVDTSLASEALTNEVPKLCLSGLGSRIIAGRDYSLQITVHPTLPGNAFVTGVWMSHGAATRTTEPNVFKLRASGQPRMITLRCFATFEDNFVAVESRQIQLTEGG